MSENRKCDVLIVGYGPVGMICAALLADQGLDVIAVERHPGLYGLPRAGHLDGETMRTFQRLGIAEAVELVAAPSNSYQIVTPDWEVIANVESGQSGSGWKSDYLIAQPDLEDIVDARTRELGARVLMGVAAESITQSPDGVRTTVRDTAHSDGSAFDIDADFVVGADGAGSFVRTAIGAHRRDLGFTSMPQLVIDFALNDFDRELPGLNGMYQLLDPYRPQHVGRWGGRRSVRWEFTAREGETRESLEKEETCWDLLRPWGITPDDGHFIRRAVYDFESSIAEPWRVGRVFLMGDGAHTMPPVLGQGLLSGIRDAENLSWKIAATIAGDADDALLDSYETERAPHVTALINMSMALGTTLLVTDPEHANKRNDALRSGLNAQPAFPRLEGGIVAPPTAGEVFDGPGAPGRPGLQARVALGTHVNRLDNLLDPRAWRIVSRHPIPADLFNDRQRQLLDSLRMQFAHVSRGASGDSSFWDIDGDYDSWYLSAGRKAYIERPDRYVFGTAETLDDLPALVDQLGVALSRYGWHAAYDSVPSA